MNLFLPLIVAAVASACSDCALPIYGIVPHLPSHRSDPLLREAQLDAMEKAGIGYMRVDFTPHRLVGENGVYDFADQDITLRQMEDRKMTVLPIIWGYELPINRLPKDLERYRLHVKTLVEHYGHRHWPVVEIWNEENVDKFFSGADPVAYAEVLKSAYAAVKEADLRVKVAFGGTSHVPIAWIRKAFEAGATNSFDIMNVHPYSHPNPPEGVVDVEIEAVRALMAEYGISAKPLWITELGYPTRDPEIMHSDVLLRGVKALGGEKRPLKVVALDVAEAELLEQLLPRGSTATAVGETELAHIMGNGGADLVFLRQSEEWPIAIRGVLLDFVNNGGIVVQMSGGVPFYCATRDGRRCDEFQDGKFLDSNLPFDYRAFWRSDAVWPRSQKMGEHVALRFLVPKPDFSGAEFIPLVTGRTDEGRELVGAAAVKCGKGGFVVSSLSRPGCMTPISEETQAKWTARGMAICFAEGVERFFAYNFRSTELDPYYSERHFGLVHSNLTPKPAYAAFVEFIKRRPQGSVNLDRPWHDVSRRHFFPAWKCPDGRVVEMRWTLGEPQWEEIPAVNGKMPRVVNRDGRCQGVILGDDGKYRVRVSDSPIYIEAGL